MGDGDQRYQMQVMHQQALHLRNRVAVDVFEQFNLHPEGALPLGDDNREIKVMLASILERIEEIEDALGIDRQYQVTEPQPTKTKGREQGKPNDEEQQDQSETASPKRVGAPDDSVECPHCHEPLSPLVLIKKVVAKEQPKRREHEQLED